MCCFFMGLFRAVTNCVRATCTYVACHNLDSFLFSGIISYTEYLFLLSILTSKFSLLVSSLNIFMRQIAT